MKTILQQVIFVFFFLCLPVLLVAQDVTYHAFLSGSQSVPSNFTLGNGTVTATLDGNELSIDGSFSDLDSDYTDSHIHLGLAGINGGVEIGLNPELDGDNRGGTFDETHTLEAADIEALEAREWYINVHTENHPGGAIRGQLLPEADAYFRANLTGSQENPQIVTEGYGSLVMERHGDDLVISGAFSDLSSDYTNSHIHEGFAGTNGGVIQGLEPAFDRAKLRAGNHIGIYEAGTNTYTLSGEEWDQLLTRELYVNVHSENYPGGEIRGQITPMATAFLIATLTSGQEMPPINTDGYGQAYLELTHDSLVVTGSFSGLSSEITAAHIHDGITGTNGGIRIDLVLDLDDEQTSGRFLAADNTTLAGDIGNEDFMDVIDDIFTRLTYINVHSGNHPGGEIRGQVLPESQAYFRAVLSGIHPVSPIATAGSGAVSVELHNSILTLSGSFHDLEDNYTASHIHIGSAAESGGVEIGLEADIEEGVNGSYNALVNTLELSGDQRESLTNEGYYINVHSEEHPGGEIRGQLLASPVNHPEAANLTSPDDGHAIGVDPDDSEELTISWSEAGDEPHLIVYRWQMATDADFEEPLTIRSSGSDTEIQLLHSELDSLLANIGIEEGETATVYHRALSSNGSLVNFDGEVRTLEVTRGQVTSVNERVTDELPREVTLNQNYPNPFNPTTRIEYGMPRAGHVTLDVYDVTGRKVATLVDASQSAGWHVITLDASSLASGLYFYRLTSDAGPNLTRQMMLVK